MTDMVPLDKRLVEVETRLVPGDLEGDLIIGKVPASSIGTGVDRVTSLTILLHLPGRRSSAAVRDALAASVGTLPASLRRSHTWDQGKEMARHKEFTAE